MKATFLALLALPLSCLAQTNAVTPAKPSTTACPDFVNKPQPSKAAYFESLRHTRPKEQTVASAVKKEKEPVKAKTHTEYIPSYSSEDRILEQKETPPLAEKPEEEKVVKENPLAKEVVAEKARTEKKPAKRKQSCNTSRKVKTSKRNTQKCPQF